MSQAVCYGEVIRENQGHQEKMQDAEYLNWISLLWLLEMKRIRGAVWFVTLAKDFP